MIAWQPFNFEGTSYSLDHLHPRRMGFEQPATGNAPTRQFQVQVIFSLHCFTRNLEDGEPAPVKAMSYSDSRETRIFDFTRYELSKQLPAIVQQLQGRKCFHSGKGNYFVIELVSDAGEQNEYEVYFDASRSSERGVINLFVQSAYIRDKAHTGNRPRKKPIKFDIILFNTLHGRPIRMPE